MLNETVLEMENQRRKDREREEKEERERAYKEAAHSASFKIFDTVLGTVTVIIAVLSSMYFVYKNSKILFAVIVIMLIMSYAFRRISKYYFIQGDMKKFERYNKLAGVMGVSASLMEFADYRRGATKDLFSKSESLEGSLMSTLRAVSEVSTTGSIYADPKYDSYRERCINLGKYTYYSGEPERVQKILSLVRAFEQEHANFPKECATCVNVLYMYAEDYMNGKYEPENADIAMACIGALHYFTNPIDNIPDTIPIAGYKDNMFMPLCVTGGCVEAINAYKDWKIKTTRESEVKKMSNVNGSFVKNLRTVGQSWYSTADTSFFSNIQKHQNDLNKLCSESRGKLTTMWMLCYDYLTGRYPYVLTESIYICLGAIHYWINPDDKIPDDKAIVGYVDDELVIGVAYAAIIKQLEEYEKWTANVRLSQKLDPLVDYLDSVIGSDETARSNEIRRLSNKCVDDTLRDDTARARAVVVQLL